MGKDSYSVEIEEGFVLTMPPEIVAKLNLQPNQHLEISFEAGGIVLTPQLADAAFKDLPNVKFQAKPNGAWLT